MAAIFRKLSVLLLLVSTMYQASAQGTVTTYSVENLSGSAGAVRFEQAFKNDSMLRIMSEAKDFIVRAFSLSPAKRIDHVVLYVEVMDGVAYSSNGNIHLSAGYVEDFRPGDTSALVTEITGVMYHEMTHVVQNSANGTPVGVIEGIADFIRLSAGFSVWTRQAGGKWDSGYSVTAFFFDWINQTKTTDFVNKLNQKIGEATAWSDNIFVELTGENVNSLWDEYQSSL